MLLGAQSVLDANQPMPALYRRARLWSCRLITFLLFFLLDQKCLAEAVALQGRKGGLPVLSERLLSFMFTQTSTFKSDAEEGEEEEEEEQKAGAGADSASVLPPYLNSAMHSWCFYRSRFYF